MRLIGISGTNGAGKDTLGQILADDYNWLFVSVSDILRDELTSRREAINREKLRGLSAEWRRQFGRDVLIDKAFKRFEAVPAKSKGLAVASLRNPGEADRVHELGGRVVWLDADPKLRYQRIYSRRRGAEDQKTFEQFSAEERAEMTHSGDDATLNMAGVKDKADIFIANQSNDLEEFKQLAAEKLRDYL